MVPNVRGRRSGAPAPQHAPPRGRPDMRPVRLLPLIALLILLSTFGSATAGLAQPGCEFALGFKALHDQIPDIVGDCVSDEAHNPDNGDAFQQTTGGLLVWRKADNWTAFT